MDNAPGESKETNASAGGQQWSDSMLLDADERRLAEKREYNRRNAARARQRVKDQIVTLTEKLEEYVAKNAELEREKARMVQEWAVLERENQNLRRQCILKLTGTASSSPLDDFPNPTSSNYPTDMATLPSDLRYGREITQVLSNPPGPMGNNSLSISGGLGESARERHSLYPLGLRNTLLLGRTPVVGLRDIEGELRSCLLEQQQLQLLSERTYRPPVEGAGAFRAMPSDTNSVAESSKREAKQQENEITREVKKRKSHN